MGTRGRLGGGETHGRPLLVKTLLLMAFVAWGAAESKAADTTTFKSVAAPTFSWSGSYVGLSGGYARGSTYWNNNVPWTTGDIKADGGIIGVTVGYNWQSGSPWVFGVEADMSWTGISGTENGATCGVPCRSSIDWLATVRGRLGAAHGDLLFFATAGVAFARVNYILDTIFDIERIETGWTTGVGLEATFAKNWSFKTEYLYVSLGKSDPLIAAVNLIARENNAHIVRGGFNYRF